VHHKQAVDLQSRINDLVSIQALPAVWSGLQSCDIVGILLEAVVRILDLDFAYACVRDSLVDSSIELIRLPQCRAAPISAEQFRRDLRDCLGGELPIRPVAISNPLRQGVVKIAPFHFGVHDELGLALAASQRSDFPTKNEMLLLRVAGSAAAIGMQEARLLDAHRRAADELERRVAERTVQLTMANEELSREIVERKRAEDAALVLKDALGIELSTMKRTEQARQESELRWRAVYENSAVGIWLANVAGRFVAANRAVQDMLGYTEAELQKLSLSDITPEEDWDGAQARIDQLRERRIPEYHAQQRYYRKDGCIIWGNTSAALIPSVDDASDLLVEIIENISARKRTEGALAQAQADLARVTRVTLIGELAASIAHEVNQPLAAVVANASACRRWLAAAPPETTEASDAADRIIRDATRASDVISRIRGFLRRGELHKAPLDLDEVIHEVIGFVQDKVNTQLVELHVEITPGTPRVFADRIQLQQVILNLMLNAIEAMEKIAQPRVLRLAVGSHGENTVRVAVSDSGPGIAAALRQRIFDAFFSTKTDGIGMGLAISRSIIEANQGRLWATKNAGRGETFQFVLPAAAPGHP
jgi:PAS domain S-box-containing protein